MRPIDVIPSSRLFQGEPPDLSGSRVFLAEGDSWFTLGALTGLPPSNLLYELDFAKATTIVSCAYPGNTLQQMSDGIDDPYFDRLLRQEPWQRWWYALLVSAGGNDLIDAAQHRATHADGSPAAPGQRLFLTAAEASTWQPGLTGAARWISQPGWQRLAAYLRANFHALAARRDEGDSSGRPIFLHTYAVPTVWPLGIPVLAPQGWLYPALLAYGIPPDERQGVATLLFQRLRELILSLDMDQGSDPLPQVHVFDSAARVVLDPPDPSATGPSGDWANEIHCTRDGYRKIGLLMGAWLETVLWRYD